MAVFITSCRRVFSMVKREFMGIVPLIALIVILSAACGCTELAGVTEHEAVHVTAVLEVTVTDISGNPVAGVPVSFYSAKYTGTSIKENSEFKFSVGYNLHETAGFPPIPETVAMTATIPGDITKTAFITFGDAEAQAGGAGAAVITRTVALQIPYEVRQ
jgi:hypothetical protein